MKKDKLIGNVINTDADSNLKGIGLQKLRAAKRLLEALIDNKKCIFCTIEYVDDVIAIDIGNPTSEINTEQNKNYTSPFSINSEEVKNSLRIFFDTWRKVEEDENITFTFYTNTSICKEKKVGEIKRLDLELPDEPVIELLTKKEYMKALPIVIPVLKDYYIEQHKKHSKDITYYKGLINQMEQSDWERFFKLIEWKFNEDDETELRGNILSVVEALCSKYGVDAKYSKGILSCIVDLIETQSLEKEFLNKIVHVAQIELLFKEFAFEVKIEEKLDPMHKLWDGIENNDSRDLQDKILYVCKDFDMDTLSELTDEFIEGKYEQSSYQDIREIKAYNYRIYSACRKQIKLILKEKQNFGFSEKEIEEIFEDLTDVSEQHILDKGKTYKIPYKDKDMVRKTILILFQECFLALDKVGDKNG